MTHPPELVELVCAHCGTVCTAYLRQAADHRSERWFVDGGGPEPPSLCPECGAELGADGPPELFVLGAHPAAD